MNCELICLVGPTASGKTARAVALARAVDGEIISADSRQVYRGMDLGTGKDLDEYGEVPYHLIDIRPAGYKYNLYEFLADCHRAIDDIQSRGRVPIICGGTGMYVEAVLNGLQLPQVPHNAALRQRLEGLSLAELSEILATYRTLHNVNDTDTVPRALRAIEIQEYYRQHPDEAVSTRPQPRTDALLIGIDVPRDVRRQRIALRLQQRLDQGMIEEVQDLIRQGVSPDDLMYYGLEYKFITLHLLGRLTREEMQQQLLTAIHQFAKRQMTWLRGMERRGHPIRWLPYDLPTDAFTQLIVHNS